jgi:periplasmic protein TonB
MAATILTMERRRSDRRRKFALAAGLAVAVGIFAVVASALLTKTPQDHHKVTQIIVLRVPPPPPPKPPEKPPEPPKQDIVKLEQPHPLDEPKEQQEQPPAGPLGLDAQGTGPGDSFGLAGRPGGRDITLAGQGGGGLGQSLFGTQAARFIAQQLQNDDKLRGTDYRIELRVWISRDGRFERYELVRGTGKPEVDALIRDGLAHLGAYRQPIPENLPQPLRIRVTSSDA